MKTMKVLILIAAAQLVAVPAYSQAEFRGIEHVTGDLYQVQDDNNTFTAFLVTPEGIILTDPINRKTATWLKAELQNQFGLPVKYLIYSHNHDGHSSGAAYSSSTYADGNHQEVNV